MLRSHRSPSTAAPVRIARSLLVRPQSSPRLPQQSPAGLASPRSPPSSPAASTSQLLPPPVPVARFVLLRAPPHAGNPAKWLLAPAAQSALPVSPRTDTSRSRTSFLWAAFGHAATGTCPADVLLATGLSLRPPELAPDRVRLHAPHPAPKPPLTRRPDSSAPASAHRAGRSSPAPRISPALTWAPLLRTSPPAS